MNRDSHGIFQAYKAGFLKETVASEHIFSKDTFEANQKDYFAYLNDIYTFVKSWQEEFGNNPEGSLIHTFIQAAQRGAQQLRKRISQDVNLLIGGDIEKETPEIVKLRGLGRRVDELGEKLSKGTDRGTLMQVLMQVNDLRERVNEVASEDDEQGKLEQSMREKGMIKGEHDDNEPFPTTTTRE